VNKVGGDGGADPSFVELPGTQFPSLAEQHRWEEEQARAVRNKKKSEREKKERLKRKKKKEAIEREIKCTNFCISRRQMYRMCKSTIEMCMTEGRIAEKAVMAVHIFLEDEMIRRFVIAGEIAEVEGKVTVGMKHLRLANRILGGACLTFG